MIANIVPWAAYIGIDVDSHNMIISNKRTN